MAEVKQNVEVVEGYRDYTPTVPAQKIVRRLLKYVPEKYLVGLKTVILRNASGLGGKDRRGKTRSRGRKVAIRESGGLYYEKRKDKPAYIVILVDNVVSNVPKALLWMPVVRNLIFAGVLYHELGHHIHKTHRPKHREKEDVADDWSLWLSHRFVKRRYWYLVWILYVVRLFFPSYWRKKKRRAGQKQVS